MDQQPDVLLLLFLVLCAGLFGYLIGRVFVLPRILRGYCRARGHPWPGDYWEDRIGRVAKIEDVGRFDVQLLVEGVQIIHAPHWKLRRDWHQLEEARAGSATAHTALSEGD